MKILLYIHATGRLAVRPLREPGDHDAPLLNLLRPLADHHWHPDQRLWTLPLEGPWGRRFLAHLLQSRLGSLSPGLPDPGAPLSLPRQPGSLL